ncbi:hypothetical protein ACTXK0_05265 [Corynebacterium variabile]|uniref:hypothetical protein n=1 Tax=Actinomycetes TaxID=1760 RepID=UPI003F99587C
MTRSRLIDAADLERSIGSDAALDAGLATWAIEMVSAAALALTRQNWSEPDAVPAGAMAVMALAARRLYSNPDNFTREQSGDYSYGLDSSVTKADIFTASEKAQLREYAAARRIQGLATVGVTAGYVETPEVAYAPTRRGGWHW